MELVRDVQHWTTSLLNAAYRHLTPSTSTKEKNISGQLVLITGTGGVIGRELAKKFAMCGCRLALWDICEGPNEETATICRSLGAKATAYVVDITKREQVYEVAKQVKEEMGRVDILVNNAGLLNPTTFLDTDDERMDKLLDVNAKSLFWTTKAFLPDMLAQGSGHLVCVCSVAGIIGSPVLVDYSASKFAAFGFMEALQHQMALIGHDFIRFTTACPIYVRTPMIDEVELNDSRLPVLKPPYVAEKIVQAVRTNKRVIMLPKKIYWLYAAKGILPWNLYQTLVIRKRCK